MADTISILIAEGDANLREQWAILLDSAKGLQVVGTTDHGGHVLSLCARLRPQVVIIEAEMPVTNGFTASLLIRRQFPDIRIILLHEGNADDMSRARDMGIHALLTKPVTLERLAQIIHTICRHDYRTTLFA